ncbi:pentatricopeptide repeat-containing protein [Dorcoceras hygrometricum]|uniref:Pentatricopeptide repeat-containing protein n=1 Tax=Dorcoceras hygrometricum TaxID=472368 RepID=A0A2Z7BIY4_9LAMI|nr:pentatricopeptide repeat-containing protein [Dorcoceras hygrometricum]
MDYLKNLQRPITDQSIPKTGKRNEVKPQYEVHKYSINYISHAIFQTSRGTQPQQPAQHSCPTSSSKTQQNMPTSSNPPRYLIISSIKAHSAYSLKLCSLKQLPQLYRALYSSKSKLNSVRNHLFKAAKEQKNHCSTITKIFELCNYFALPQHVDPSLQTSINRKISRIRAQHHQYCSQQRRKSKAIDGEKGSNEQ